MSGNVFTLSKREQRAILAIVLALLFGTVAIHFRSLRTEIQTPPAQSDSPPADDEQDATR